MDIYWYICAFVLGTIVGSFLNVVIYRLHTGKSMGGHSHCLSCGKQLRWYELIPLFSYLALRGRCGNCSSWIPVRYFLVELVTGLLFLLFWHFYSSEPTVFGFYAVLTAFLIIICVYDVRHTIIPDEMVIGVGILSLAYVAYSLFIDKVPFHAIAVDIIGGMTAGPFFWGLWYVSGGRWIGLGDAKLALPLGIIVGFPGVFSMVVLSFWIGALLSLFLLFLNKFFKKGKTNLLNQFGHITIKSEIPFAPFMIMGFLLVELFHADIFEITLWFFPFW